MKNIILLACIFSFSTISYAQIENKAPLFIAKNTLVSVSQDFTNNAEMANNGKLVVQNNLTNNAKFTSEGKLIVDGKGSQDFDGSKNIQTSEIDINNDLNLKTNLIVGEKIAFNKGVVNTYSGSSVDFKENASHSGGSDASHVNGLVKKEGATNFEFPLGDGVNYKAFSVKGSPSNLEAKYVAANPMSFSSELDNDLAEINQTEYWTLKSDGNTANIDLKNNELALLKNGIWVKNGNSTTERESFFTSSKGKSVAKEIGIWPNPTKGEFNLKLTGMKDTDEVMIDITNDMGLSILNMKGKVEDLRKVYQIPSGLVASTLTVKLINGKEALTQKLILLR